MDRLPKSRFRKDHVLVSDDGEFLPNLPGYVWATVSHACAPKREEIRHMLLELRQKLHWSQELTAGVLGVPLVTLRRWENGTRRPSGAARKLIFLLHDSFLCRPKKIQNACDLLLWGQITCRSSLEDCLSIAKSMAIPRQEFLDQAARKMADESDQAKLRTQPVSATAKI